MSSLKTWRCDSGDFGWRTGQVKTTIPGKGRIGPGAWAFNGQRATSARTNSTPGHVEGRGKRSPTKLNHILISLGPLLSKI
ncbi:hypothetical protein FOBRF1_004756 [Fusarium oxysporum]